SRTDDDRRPPLGEARAELAVFLKPLAQAVEALGDRLAGLEGKGLGPGVDLDAGKRTTCLDDVDEERAVLGFLADGLVVEDDAGYGARHRLAGTEKHLAVVAPALLGRGDTDLVEALGDGGGALVGGEDPLARRNHLQSGLSQSFSHECDLPCMSVTDIAGPYNALRRPFPAR